MEATKHGYSHTIRNLTATGTIQRGQGDDVDLSKDLAAREYRGQYRCVDGYSTDRTTHIESETFSVHRLSSGLFNPELANTRHVLLRGPRHAQVRRGLHRRWQLGGRTPFKLKCFDNGMFSDDYKVCSPIMRRNEASDLQVPAAVVDALLYSVKGSESLLAKRVKALLATANHSSAVLRSTFSML